MGNVESLFNKRRAEAEKLRGFGFVKGKGGHVYSVGLMGGQFRMEVTVSKDSKVRADVFDAATGEIYEPVKVFGATGAFVGKLRAEYEKVLEEISERCFCRDSFTSDQAREVIEYVRRKYGDELEFLWPKFSQNAILRRKDNEKWYAALLNLQRCKMGLEGEELVDIINLRMEPERLEKLVDGKKYFAGFHMNKRHWVTICLDGSVSVKGICERIDESYRLAKK